MSSTKIYYLYFYIIFHLYFLLDFGFSSFIIFREMKF